MNAGLRLSITSRREVLQREAAAQRHALRSLIIVWEPPLAVADRGLRLATTLRRQPLWLLLPVVLLVVARPPRLLPWLQRGWLAWRMLRQIAG